MKQGHRPAGLSETRRRQQLPLCSDIYVSLRGDRDKGQTKKGIGKRTTIPSRSTERISSGNQPGTDDEEFHAPFQRGETAAELAKTEFAFVLLSCKRCPRNTTIEASTLRPDAELWEMTFNERNAARMPSGSGRNTKPTARHSSGARGRNPTTGAHR